MVLVKSSCRISHRTGKERTLLTRGIRIDVSTLADRIGACVVALDPLLQAIRAHVLSAARIRADDTTVPVLAKLKISSARSGPTSAMTSRSAAGDPPAAFRYSRSRADEPTQKVSCWLSGPYTGRSLCWINQLYKSHPPAEAALLG
jgi:transposase